jgi:hypothetical protein
MAYLLGFRKSEGGKRLFRQGLATDPQPGK